MDSRRLHVTFPSSSTKDVHQFQKALPDLSEPAEIGCFSLSYVNETRREFHDDARGLRLLLRRPSYPLSLDLKEGFDTYKKFDEGARMNEHLDHFLHWILLHPQEFLFRKQSHKSRKKELVVCVRGSLTDLMMTPYEKNDGWIFVVCRIDGVLYLTKFETEQDVYRWENGTEEKENFMYWGYKFEQYMQVPPEDPQAFQGPINNSEGFHSVIYTKLSDTGILLVGEMDCLDPKAPPTTPAPFCYVELKTTKLYPGLDLSVKQTFLCGPKLLKYWAQSAICGVPKILIGFRNGDGVVEKTEEVATVKLPLLAKEASRHGLKDSVWKQEVCLNFLDGFLKFVGQVVAKDYDKAAYKFEWSPGKSGVNVSEEAPGSRWNFIPEWYLQSRPGQKVPVKKVREAPHGNYGENLLRSLI